LMFHFSISGGALPSGYFVAICREVWVGILEPRHLL
jgi:hypothetical protein